jgi:hypothetical protein
MKLQCFEKLAKTHYIIHLYHYSNNIHNDMYETYEITYVNKSYFQRPPILQQFTFNTPTKTAEMNAVDSRISTSSMRKHRNSLQYEDICYDENATESILGLYHGSKFKEIHLYNENHLGDCIFSCVYFYHIREYIESNHIHIFYYIRKEHISQVREFICSNNIHLCDFDKRKGLHIWIGNRNINTNILKVFEGYADHLKKNNKTMLNEFLVEFYNTISAHFEIPYKMVSYQYCDPILLDTYYELPDKYKNVDIFIINSRPLSSQYQYNEKEWDIRILQLNEKYNIVTTKKVDEVKCTLDDRLSIFRIAALSTRAKVIIAINTGPIVGLFNIYTLNHVKKAYISENTNLYTYPNFESRNSIIDIPFHELDKYINS